MKYRPFTLEDGTTVQVPQGIQRIESKSTRGWQVRCQGTKLFSDGPSRDAVQSLANATRELLARLASAPASRTLRQTTSPRKRSDLPVGLSGPIVRNRPGRAAVAELSVLLPRYGSKPEAKNIYIGSENTYSVERYQAAVARALELREEAIQRYEREALKSKRVAVAQLKAGLSSLRNR